MPTPRSWLPRIEEILYTIRVSSSDHFARAAIERLFEVQRRSALLLMNSVGCKRLGSSYVVSRTDLLHWVEEIERTEAQELVRRQHVLDEIAREAEQWKAVRGHASVLNKPLVQFPIVEEIARAEFSRLPEGIAVTPGRITISFDPADPEELCEKLYALSKALVNDLIGFSKIMKKAAPYEAARNESLAETCH